MTTLLDGGHLREAVAALRLAGPDVPVPPGDADRPIFLLSAGWRSGSTLVQRLITSDPSVLMWGEPFGDHIPVHRLAQIVEPFDEHSAHLACSIERFEGRLSDQWIANLNPGVDALKAAHREFFVRLFGRPASERGFARWGCKWVRLTAGHACYLRWLFPSARFVFLVRHPLHAFRSYKGRRWYFARPDHQVRTLPQFMRHWNATADSFVSHGDSVGALLVRYEDVVGETEKTLRRLSAHLDVRIDPGVLDARIGSRKTADQAGLVDRALLRMYSGHACAALGYGLNGEVRPYEAVAGTATEDGRSA